MSNATEERTPHSLCVCTEATKINAMCPVHNSPISRSQIKRKTIQKGGTMEDAQREIERVDERKSCPELVQKRWAVCWGSDVYRQLKIYHSEESACKWADLWVETPYVVVPCEVRPLLTADDRKKLIGGEG